MSDYLEQQVALIDERIAVARQRTTAKGTLVSRDAAGAGCVVLHDGAGTPTPALLPASVFALENARVALELFGSDWIVIGAFMGPAFGEANRAIPGLSALTGALTSSPFTDLIEFGSFTFAKIYDRTVIRIGAGYGAFSSATNTAVQYAVRLSPIAGGVGYTPTDYAIGSIYFNVASAHQRGSGAYRISGVPSGTYTVTLRWRRSVGAGNVQSDTLDSYFVEIDERVGAGIPGL